MRKFHFIPQQTEKSAFGSCESSRCWTTLSRFILEILSDLKLFNPKALAQPKYRFFRLLGYIFVGLIFFLSFSSCSYHLDGPGRLEQLTTLSIPYVQGDSSGQLTSELAKQISASGAFDYVQNNGQLILKVKVLTDGSERLGYRYDRKGVQGKRKKFLVAMEGRRMMNAEITLIMAST